MTEGNTACKSGFGSKSSLGGDLGDGILGGGKGTMSSRGFSLEVEGSSITIGNAAGKSSIVTLSSFDGSVSSAPLGSSSGSALLLDNKRESFISSNTDEVNHTSASNSQKNEYHNSML